MNKLEKRGEQMARARQELAIGLIAQLLKERLRGVRVEAGQSEIRISGAGLFKRWLTETGLRFVAGSIR